MVPQVFTATPDVQARVQVTVVFELPVMAAEKAWVVFVMTPRAIRN